MKTKHAAVALFAGGSILFGTAVAVAEESHWYFDDELVVPHTPVSPTTNENGITSSCGTSPVKDVVLCDGLSGSGGYEVEVFGETIATYRYEMGRREGPPPPPDEDPEATEHAVTSSVVVHQDLDGDGQDEAVAPDSTTIACGYSDSDTHARCQELEGTRSETISVADTPVATVTVAFEERQESTDEGEGS